MLEGKAAVAVLPQAAMGTHRQEFIWVLHKIKEHKVTSKTGRLRHA